MQKRTPGMIEAGMEQGWFRADFLEVSAGFGMQKIQIVDAIVGHAMVFAETPDALDGARLPGTHIAVRMEIAQQIHPRLLVHFQTGGYHPRRLILLEQPGRDQPQLFPFQLRSRSSHFVDIPLRDVWRDTSAP